MLRNHVLRDVFIVPGYQGSDLNHWQSVWESQYPAIRRINQRNWTHPQCHDWLAALEEQTRSSRAPIFIGHSLGCIAVVQAIAQKRIRPRAVFLVAPVDIDENLLKIQATGFGPIPMKQLPCPSMIVASSDDPYTKSSRSLTFASFWGSEVYLLERRGHINSESYLGAWDEGQRLFSKLLSKIESNQFSGDQSSRV